MLPPPDRVDLPIPIRDRPLLDRPRERLMLLGEESLADAELVALIVGPVASRSSEDVASELVATFGSARGLQRADAVELQRDGRLGMAGACALAAAFALARRAARASLDAEARVRGGADLFERFRQRLAGARKETFFAVYLDSRNRVVREERVSEGTLTSALVHPREVFGPALRCGAASVVVVHNHPSGDPTPSSEDFEVTRRLREAGALVGVPLLDHLIVGEERYASFLERGM